MARDMICVTADYRKKCREMVNMVLNAPQVLSKQ